ncbi:hypothetical protein BDN70DRAFT_552388 [Pholiota conissans]|uniref:Uncharacterized protein n=1 Tax=Pholiota conissans TaxID=109636 RepID=A0A9P5Z737_9AGAR|nr:hypothetical protein BDN70DRAFT_552388 [Pholiota conissans]
MAIFSVFKFKSKSKTSKFSIPAPTAPDLVASVESQPANSACRFTVDIGSVPSTEERSTDDADMGNFGFPFNIPTIIVTSEDQSSTTIAGFSVPFHKTPSKGTPVTEAESEVEDEDEASDDDDDTPVQEITGSQTYNGGVQNNNVYEKNSNNEYVHNENTTIVGDTNVEVCPAATSEGRTSDFLFSPGKSSSLRSSKVH